MDFERETEELLKRLEKSNKIFVANAATEGWKIRKIFPAIKEKYPKAKLYKCTGIIYLTVSEEQTQQLIRRLREKRTKYAEMQKSGQYEFGTDEGLTGRYLEEIGKVLQELEEE